MSEFMDIIMSVGEEMVQDMGAELKRLGVQGQAELANALFNGQAYLPYGDGQRSMEAEQPTMELPEQSNGRSM